MSEDAGNIKQTSSFRVRLFACLLAFYHEQPSILHDAGFVSTPPFGHQTSRHIALSSQLSALSPSVNVSVLQRPHLPPFHQPPSNTPPVPPTETQTRPPCPSTVGTPPHTYRADNPPHRAPSHPAPPSGSSNRPRASASACRRSRRDRRRPRGWRRARPSGCASAVASASGSCGIGWSVWAAGGCAVRLG